MKKTLRRTIVIMITIMTLAIGTVSASAANSTVTSLKLSKTSVTISQGEAVAEGVSFGYIGAKPNVKDIKWTTSNSSIATVKNGVIKGNTKAGTATITAELGGKKATCKVTVKATDTNNAYAALNSYRAKAKVKALKRDAKLEKIAQIRAEEMAKTGKFSHTRPNGKSGLTLISGNIHKGENIAKGQISADSVTKAWYNSAGHRANMLRSAFTKVGIASYTYNGVTYWAQVFSS